MLKEIVNKCLQKAQTKGYQSIAFPALGTGKLGYPADEVAKAMLQAAIEYAEKNADGSVTTVKIVIFHTDTIIQQVIKLYD